MTSNTVVHARLTGWHGHMYILLLFDCMQIINDGQPLALVTSNTEIPPRLTDWHVCTLKITGAIHYLFYYSGQPHLR